jgi:hypothetical protein
MPNAVAITGGDATIVARVIGEMAASGEAALTTLNQVSVSVGYDDLYEVTLSAADSTKLANAFKISGSGATFLAHLENSADFQQVLAGAMSNAVCVGPGGSNPSVGKKLDKAIYDEMLNQFKRIFTDALPNLLESDWALSNVVEWAAGAEDMAGKLDNKECEILAQQLPESNYELYMDGSENPVTDALSLKGNDSVIFVFDVAESGVARNITKTEGTNSDVGATAEPNGAFGDLGAQNVNAYTANNRLVAFKLIVKNAASSAGALDSLRAVPA